MAIGDKVTNHSGNDAPNLPQTAQEMWAYTLGYYKHVPGDMETLLWKVKILDKYPERAIINAFLGHIDNSVFAPKIPDIKKLLDVDQVHSAAAGLLTVQQLVKQTGPYKTPAIESSVLRATVDELGGWAAVCAELPDPSSPGQDFERYQKRFSTAFERATHQVQIYGAEPKKLTGLIPESSQSNLVKELPAPARSNDLRILSRK